MLNYTLFKNDKLAETYTFHLNNINQRKLFARLRCGYIKINVNIGRLNNTDYEQRKCKFCNEGNIDDEFHFLLCCPFHVDIRKKYIPSYYRTQPNLIKCCSLVNSNSRNLILSICNFVKAALKQRNDVIIVI